MDEIFIDMVIKKLQWLLDHPEVTWSGSGIYALSLTGSAGLAVASWCFWRKKQSPPSSKEDTCPLNPTNQFKSSGDEQNIAQGQNAVGKQINHYNNISPDVLADVRKLAVTDSALASFFKILEEQQVPLSDLDSKLREIAGHYKLLQLMAQLNNVQSSSDPQMRALKEQARQAIEAGDFAKAEYLLEDVASHYSISAAETYAELASLQRVQLRYAKAAAYWQKAAALLPDDKKKERAKYLHEAGYDLHSVSRYKEALPLYEQSLRIRQEIGFKVGEGRTLNNISQIYDARGDYPTALKYLEQSLHIMQEIGDKVGEDCTLNNIGAIHHAKGDYDKALSLWEQSLRITQETGNKAGEGAMLNNIGAFHHAKGDCDKALSLWEQSLHIMQEIGDKAGEGTTLNNISQIYDARGDYPTALKYLEQSLRITQEIGDRAGEAVTNWNIGRAYYEHQSDLAKAEQYMSRAVQLAEKIGHPELELLRKGLARVCAKIKGR